MKGTRFEARLVWHVVGHEPLCAELGCSGEEHVIDAWNDEDKAREQAIAIGGWYMLVCNVLSARGPWRRLETPDGRLLRMQSNHVDWIGDDYAAWWSRVNVRVEVRDAA